MPPLNNTFFKSSDGETDYHQESIPLVEQIISNKDVLISIFEMIFGSSGHMT